MARRKVQRHPDAWIDERRAEMVRPKVQRHPAMLGTSLGQLYEKHGGRCHYCGRLTSRDGAKEQHPTRDHYIPKSRGGRNVVLACWRCNNEKGSLTGDEYFAVLFARRLGEAAPK